MIGFSVAMVTKKIICLLEDNKKHFCKRFVNIFAVIQHYMAVSTFSILRQLKRYVSIAIKIP